MGEMYRYGGAPATTRFAEPRQGQQMSDARFVDPFSNAMKRPRTDFEELAPSRGMGFSQPLQDDRVDRFQYVASGGGSHFGEQRGPPPGRALDPFPPDMLPGYRDGPYTAGGQQQMLQAAALGGVPLLRDEPPALHRGIDGVPRGMESMVVRGMDLMPRGLPLDPMGQGMEAMPRGRLMMDPPLPLEGDPRDMLPPEASPTLFIEGLPSDCTRREAAHIFRPFIGFKEVRLVFKDAKRGPADSKITLCFAEFADARCSATALEALQGYRFDEEDPRSSSLRLMFARHPGPRAALSMRDDRQGAGGLS